MLTCFPKLLYNFIYRGFSIRDVLDNPAEAARWLAARDLTIAATFCRCAFPSSPHSRTSTSAAVAESCRRLAFTISARMQLHRPSRGLGCCGT